MQFLKELMIGISTKVKLDGLNQGMANINAKLNNVKMGFQGLNNKISGLEVAGMAAGLGLMVKSASNFEYQMQLIGNTANLSSDEIKGMTKDVMDLSTKTNQLPENMQKALGFLIATGMDKNMAKESLESIGKVATATGSDIEDVSKTVAALEQNLKVKPSELNQTMDMLASAGKAGNFELKDMASYLPTLTAGYQSLGATGYKSAASLGAALQIARMGAGDASEAANNTRNFLGKLTAQDTVKNFKKMGVNLQAEIKKGIDSGDLMGHMVGLIKKVTGGDKFKLNKLFSDMQVTNFLNPMMQNFEEYKKIRDEALNSRGVVNTDFEKMLGTSSEQFKALKIQSTELALTLGAALIPPLLELTKSLKPIIADFVDWAKEHPDLIEGIMVAAVGVIGLNLGIKTIAGTLGALKAPLKIAGWLFKGLGLDGKSLMKDLLDLNLVSAKSVSGLDDGAKAAGKYSGALDKLGKAAKFAFKSLTTLLTLGAAVEGVTLLQDSNPENIQKYGSSNDRFHKMVTSPIQGAKDIGKAIPESLSSMFGNAWHLLNSPSNAAQAIPANNMANTAQAVASTQGGSPLLQPNNTVQNQTNNVTNHYSVSVTGVTDPKQAANMVKQDLANQRRVGFSYTGGGVVP